VTSAARTSGTRKPLVTALMPVGPYHEDWLREAVASVMEQTSPDWRLIIIAEKRVRPQLASVLSRELADPRIELIAKEGRQIGGSYNTGMRRAETEFVAILMGDDVWSRDAVEVLTRHIKASPGIDFFHSARRFMDGEGRPISSVMPSHTEVSVEDFFVRSPVKHLLCWRREKGLAIRGMDESLKSVGVDDYDFPWSMAEHGASFQAIPDCLYVFRDHRDHFRLTTHLPLSQHKRELGRILRKHGADEATIAERVAAAEESFLRQCLYRSRFDRWMKRLGLRAHDPQRGWREPYR
jgi:glycosyltransferase involved in cell wall biosynthesis